MKLKLYPLLCWILLLSSCNTSEKSDQQEPLTSEEKQEEQLVVTKSAFQKLCEKLPEIQLPYSVYCEKCCVHPKLAKEQTEIKKYLPEGTSFVGIIEINENYISMLITHAADWIIPAVIVLDIDGKLIDEEIFLGGYCGSDYEYIGKQYFFIDSPTQLREVDTSLQVNYHEETFDIKDTLMIEIVTKNFKIDPKGISKVL
ncbi:MAG: hypothetical protein EP338_09885 [Bacteroidetes bacterium]|nr:MAG: hypothetical protein EP338_09885 [Bacteroidota bacterium]